MHVFMRTHDLESVFYREELVNWQKAKGKKPTEEDGLPITSCWAWTRSRPRKCSIPKSWPSSTSCGFSTRSKRVSRRYAEGRYKNYRFRSAVLGRQRARLSGHVQEKTYESYRQYIEAPLIDIVDDFDSESARIENGAEQDFSPQHFASVMDELLPVKRIGDRERPSLATWARRVPRPRPGKKRLTRLAQVAQARSWTRSK